MILDNIFVFDKNGINMPYGIINYSQTDFKRKRNSMIEFVKAAFRFLFVIGIWIDLILCTIGGGVIANMTYSRSYYGSSGVHPILGAFLGLLVGFWITINIRGLIATFLNIDENLEQLKYYKKNSVSSDSSHRQEEKKCNRCGKMISGGYTSCPHCGASDLSNHSVINNSPIVVPKDETKRCKSCGKIVNSNVFKCPKCKGEDFV
jgi:RNA polymerase subunit RPABC4/transcription elongation factor Spt4